RYPKLRWIFYFDQSALYLCFLLSSLRGRPSFYRLRKSVVDFEFSAAACIWTAKGRRKNDAVFLTESRRIMERYHWGHHDHAGLAASRWTLSEPCRALHAVSRGGWGGACDDQSGRRLRRARS